MAMSSRLRSGIPLLRNVLRHESVIPSRSGAAAVMGVRNISSDSNWKEAYVPVITSMISGTHGAESGFEKPNIKVPLTLFGGTGNYATALYLAASKANKLDKVESEIRQIVEIAKKNPEFSEFIKDLSIPRKERVKYVEELCSKSGFSDITKNFLVVLADYGRLRYVEKIAGRLFELTRAYKGEVPVTVTTVIPLPPEEDKQLKETLKGILGPGKTAIVEQKIDPNILGGIMVEFDQKLFDMSIRTRAQKFEMFLREPGNFEKFVNSEKAV